MSTLDSIFNRVDENLLGDPRLSQFQDMLTNVLSRFFFFFFFYSFSFSFKVDIVIYSSGNPKIVNLLPNFCNIRFFKVPQHFSNQENRETKN